MPWLFFSLPFFLYAGIAAQTGGIYLCMVLIPFCIRFNVLRHNHQGRIWWQLGIALVVIWHIYVLSNFLTAHWPMRATVAPLLLEQTLSGSSIFASRVSSTLGISGIALTLFGLLSKFRCKDSQLTPATKADPNLFLRLIYGFAFASTIYGVLFFVQHVSGIDIRRSELPIAYNNMMASGLFRITGFYGHPLSMAGASLAVATFFWTLGWAPGIESLNLSASKQKTVLSRFEPATLVKYVALVNFVFLFMSGSRMPIALGAVIFLLIPLVYKGRRTVTAWRAGVCLAIFSVAVYLSGLGRRFYELIEHVQSGQFLQMERLIFWRVHGQMFLDSPWYGHGYLKSSREILPRYYEALGYQHLENKYNAHNVYVQTMTDTGLIGVVILVMMLAWLVTLASKVVNTSPIGRSFWLAFLAAIAANMVHGLTQNTFLDDNVIAIYLGFFWTLLWIHQPARADQIHER